MLLPRFQYEAPPLLDRAIELLAQGGSEACVLAGGTDLLVRMKRRAVRPRLLVALSRVRGLRGTTAAEHGGVRIGPLTTMTELADSCLLPDAFAAVREGAASVGGPIIRNRATVGGNIVNARPCADTVPGFMVLGARLQLQGRAGRRSTDVDGFISGPGRSSIHADEVVTAIDVPPPVPFSGSCYLKLTRRAAMEVTIVGCAAAISLEEDARTVRSARLVFASVAPVPLRVMAAEAAVEGRELSEAALREAASIARGNARPIDDCRAPADYRSEIVEVLASRALTLAATRAGWRRP